MIENDHLKHVINTMKSNESACNLGSATLQDKHISYKHQNHTFEGI